MTGTDRGSTVVALPARRQEGRAATSRDATMQVGTIHGTNPMAVPNIAASSASASPTPPMPPTVPSLQRFEGLVGEWSGTGWIRTGPGAPTQFTAHETVESRLDGTVLVIEGNHVDADSVPVHRTFGVLSGDPSTGAYRLDAWTAGGAATRGTATATDSGLQWGYTHPRAGEIRFTIEQEGDRWHEVGEMSRDGGTTWLPFFEMHLTRA